MSICYEMCGFKIVISFIFHINLTRYDYPTLSGKETKLQKG